jgi:outer membrane usher protein
VASGEGRTAQKLDSGPEPGAEARRSAELGRIARRAWQRAREHAAPAALVLPILVAEAGPAPAEMPEPAAGPPEPPPVPEPDPVAEPSLAPPDPAVPPPESGTSGTAARRAVPPAPRQPAVTSVSSAPAKQVLPPARELQRDPVEPPLEERQAWREWVLSVRLNGQAASQGGLFVEAPGTGELAAQLALLEAWRVRVDSAKVITFGGEPYYPLAAIPGARFQLDRQALSLALEIPPEQFVPSSLAGMGERSPPPVAGVGGFLDYDLLYQAGDDLDQGLNGLAEVGGFGPLGTLLSSFRLENLTEDPGATRLDTTLSRDLPDSRLTLRLGDSIAVGGAFAAPVRFAGLQYATNFAVDPTFVTFPLPSIGGLARQDSVVDLFIDNLQRETRSVPPGPFTLESLPVVTGAGDVQLRVTDLLGREQIVTQPYYVSSRLLKQGLHDYSYEAGAERRDYGTRSFDYGEALAAATHRYGFTDRLTGEAHAELQPDQQSLAVGGSTLLGLLGVVSGGVGASGSNDGGGLLGQLAYEYDGRRFNFGARTRYTTDSFRQAGSDEEARRIDQLSLGVDLGGYGRLGMLALHRDSRDDDDVTSLAATYSLPLGPGALTLRAAQLVEPDQELALTALYTLPLGPRRSASSELLKRGDEYRARAQFRQTRGASDLGLDYRLAAETGTERSYADARFSYQSTLGAGDLEVEQLGDSSNLRAGVNGSMALVDGELALSRRLGRAFGLVYLPGFPDVRVYLDNREAGRTDAGGRLLLPDLRPYEGNRVRLEVDDLPLDAELDTAELDAVPYERAGMTISFPIARGEQATAVLRAADGAPLPVGLRLRSIDGRVTVWVARDGFAQVKGPLAAPVLVASEDGGAAFACELPAAPQGEILPDLGEVTCR